MLREDVLEKCSKFADESSGSAAMYVKQRNADPKRVRDQIFQGKLAECASAVFLHREFGFPRLEPDFAIYKVREKSWAADLPYSTVSGTLPDVHVKSADTITSQKFEESYVFQLTDTLFRRKKDRDIISMVLFNPETKELQVRAIAAWSYLNEKELFGLMRVHQLRSQKCCVYYDDLLRYNQC